MKQLKGVEKAAIEIGLRWGQPTSRLMFEQIITKNTDAEDVAELCELNIKDHTPRWVLAGERPEVCSCPRCNLSRRIQARLVEGVDDGK